VLICDLSVSGIFPSSVAQKKYTKPWKLFLGNVEIPNIQFLKLFWFCFMQFGQIEPKLCVLYRTDACYLVSGTQHAGQLKVFENRVQGGRNKGMESNES
jgi:hypothetical protein